MSVINEHNPSILLILIEMMHLPKQNDSTTFGKIRTTYVKIIFSKQSSRSMLWGDISRQEFSRIFINLNYLIKMILIKLKNENVQDEFTEWLL